MKRAPVSGDPLGWLLDWCRRRGLHLAHVLGLQAFRPLLHLELDLRAFIQAAIPVRLNRGKVNKYIVTTGPLDESIAFGGVKPLHDTFFPHYNLLKSNRSSCSWVFQARKADFRGLLKTCEARPNNRLTCCNCVGYSLRWRWYGQVH